MKKLVAREEPTIDYKHIVAHLLHHGYATFMLPQLSSYIDPIFQDYKKFLSTDIEFRKKWSIHMPSTKLADHGYVPPKGEGYDPKHTFQWRTQLKHMLFDLQPGELEARESLLSREEFARYEDWFAYLGDIFKTMKRVMLEMCQEIDRQVPGINLYNQLRKPELIQNHVIRLLEYVYDPSRKGEALASKHTDQGAMTFQWYESDPGLVVIDKEGTDVPYDYEPGKVVAFFGKKIVPATNGLLLPTEHYVNSNAQTNRNSGIFFMHTDHPSIELR